MYVTITAVLIAVISYLLGSVNSAVIISKTLFKKDVREEGSGNAGATNMLRSHGKAAGAATLICDILKGIVAILIARGIFAFLFKDKYWSYVSLLNAVDKYESVTPQSCTFDVSF